MGAGEAAWIVNFTIELERRWGGIDTQRLEWD